MLKQRKHALIRCLTIFVAGAFSTISNAGGPYTVNIASIQTIDEVSSKVWVVENIVNSPCAGTNQSNRFAISNKTQYMILLSAYMSSRTVAIYTVDGVCDGLNLEYVNQIRIRKF